MNRLTHEDDRVYISGTSVNPHVHSRGFCDARSVKFDLQKTFIQRLQEEMGREQISGNELARRSGIAQSTISRTLKGKQELTLSRIGMLADALNVPAWCLLADPSQIEQRIIRPVANLASPEKVVRLHTQYGQIFAKTAEQNEKPTKGAARQRKKR